MPMNFPDMPSLILAAEVHGYRAPDEGETEADFRSALADFVAPRDLVESQEIRTGKGWDRFDDKENRDMIIRGMLANAAKNRRR